MRAQQILLARLEYDSAEKWCLDCNEALRELLGGHHTIFFEHINSDCVLVSNDTDSEFKRRFSAYSGVDARATGS